MDELPVASKTHTSYENFAAQCPWCGNESIFNRASDLRTFEVIAGLDVSCQVTGCQKSFRIVGDSINSPHEMLIFDCYELLDRKHYMACILTLAQAYEVFFSLFLRVELVYKPFQRDSHQELTVLNHAVEELYEKTANFTFRPMRALFLQHVAAGRSPKDLSEARTMIAGLPSRPKEPDDALIAGLNDPKLVPLFKKLKATEIHRLRNRVVHKQAYRPTRGEVESALEETRAILFPLTSYLQLSDDPSFYLRSA